MKNEPTKKNSTAIPLVIIGLVLVAVVGGAYWLYKGSVSPNVNTAGKDATGTPRPSQTVNPNAPVGANPPNMLGSPTATVTVEEFADFQCGSCAATHPVMKEIQSTYGSKIKFVFRQFPLSIHDKAYDAAVAAEAAGIQGKFWAMQDQLFQNQQAWASPSADYRQMWTGYAEKIGLDVQQWQSDIAGISAKSRVDQDMQRGKALNVSSTPSIYINGEPVPYPEANVAGLRRIIDAKLQGGAQTQAPAPAVPAGSTNSVNSSNGSDANKK